MKHLIEGFRQVDNWVDILSAVDNGEVVYYRAPLDPHPQRILARRFRLTIRVSPLVGRSFDPFSADSSHIDRFFLLDAAPISDDSVIDAPEAVTYRDDRGEA